ncbi:MAG: OmpH family outer membrane protein [Cryomorphaceae bacterium]|nr:OmpH family outer membrane protein [Flavobacteriales bacterium]
MKKLIIIMAVFLGALTQAEAQKLGHANFEEIVTMLPERAESEKKVQELQQKLENRLSKMIETYQAKVAEFENDQEMSAALKTSAQGEIEDLQRRIQEFQQTAYTEIETKQNELMAAMFKKVREAAAKVGAEEQYTYVFDSSSQGGLLYAGGEDITSKVKTELGI